MGPETLGDSRASRRRRTNGEPLPNTHGARAKTLVYSDRRCSDLAVVLLAHRPAQPLLVLPYALFVILAVFIYMSARRSKWQDKSQDYRAFEIGLAVQHVWDRVGLNKSVGASYLRRQRTELDWIRAAIRTAHVLILACRSIRPPGSHRYATLLRGS